MRYEFETTDVGVSVPVEEGQPPLTLTPSGRGVETATHKLVQTDAGETEFFDSVTDPDGTNNLAADPAYAEQLQALMAKFEGFPAAEVSASAPMEAIPVGPVAGAPSAPEVPKVAAPGPAAPRVPTAPPAPSAAEVPAVPEVPAPMSAAPPKPAPVSGKITLPEPGLPKLSDVPKLDLPNLPEAPKVPELPKPAGGPPPVPDKVALPKPGLPPTPDQGASAKPGLPPLPSMPKPIKPDVPMSKESASEKTDKPDSSESSEPAKPALPPQPSKPVLPILKNDDETDPDIEFEKGTAPPPEPKVKPTAKPIDAKGAGDSPPAAPRRSKKEIDPVDSKRKSRIEAETAVKNAQRELEEARVREEMMAREELEAHKTALERARKELTQLDGEIGKVKKTDTAKLEKNHAALEKLKQEYEHDEDLVRHTIRAKKAAHLDHEDRLSDLDNELHRLHEDETERIRRKEGEDLRRKEESRVAHERYLERVKTDEEEVVHHQSDIEILDEEEESLKKGIAIKEQKFQERAKEIKFEEDDEHSRSEHEQEVLYKRREKFEEQVNIETDEIAAMNAKLDARKIVRADEKKMERMQVVAEHEADNIKNDRAEDPPVKIAKPVIDRDQPPAPDEEPPLPKSGEAEPLPKPKIAKPVAMSTMPAMPKPVSLPEDKPELSVLPKLAAAKPELPALPKPATDKPTLPVLPTLGDAKPELPALPKPAADKPALPVLPTLGDAKPELPALPKPAADKPALPVLPTLGGDKPELPALPVSGALPTLALPESTAPEAKKGFFGKLFAKKKKDDSADPIATLPAPGPGAPKPTLPPMPGASASGGLGGDEPKPVLPAFPTGPKGGASKPELPALPPAFASTPDSSEAEKEILKNKLQRIAQDRADRLKDGEGAEMPTLPALPTAPKPGGAPGLPPLPGGGLPPLPQPGGSGGGGVPNLPPLPGPPSIESEAEQQTRDQEKGA
jgi:hypothetical protein